MKKNKRFPGGKRENLIRLIILGSLVLMGFSVPGTSHCESIVQQGPVLNALADVKPCIRVTLSAERIHFHADKGPAIYEPDEPEEPVVITVGCNARDWSIQCEATPFEENATRKEGRKWTVPPSQLFVASALTQGSADAKVEKGYSALDNPVTILQGGAGETNAELRFKLETTWSDRAGTYTGEIRFTCMMNP